MNLGDKISVTLEITGEVVGRTFEGDPKVDLKLPCPKVDLKLPWGMLNGIPISVLKFKGGGESEKTAVESNVTEIRQAVRKRGKVAATG
jgi:hypothetical protein